VTYDELVELTDTLAGDLVPMPSAGPDVCPHCHTARDESYPLCYSCGRVRRGFGHPCPHVLPISFYMTPAANQPISQLREWLHDYKEHADDDVRNTAGVMVAGILARYLVEHATALRERLGDWDHLVAVPSKKHDGPPALAVALADFDDHLGAVSPLLQPGPGEIQRSIPNAAGFETRTNVNGLRVLLVDDTFTTGATLHSAAHALVAGGAIVLAAVVVARKINPDPRWANTAQVWDRQVAIPFSFTDEPFWYDEL
jgi:predicted amidophosphoribosyltransferase